MKVWITKYALRDGVQKVEATLSPEYPKCVSWGGYKDAWGEGKEWHRTQEAAIARAEEMRIAKIASLKRQIAKLEKMEFKA